MDRRVRKTRKALEEAFIALSLQKPLSQITVAELTDLADVGRGTFYLHYQDVGDLQHQLVTAQVDALIAKFAQAPPEAIAGSYHGWLNSLLAELQRNRSALALLQSSGDASIRQRLCAAFAAQLPGDRLAAIYLVNGGFGVLAAWLAGELVVAQAELVAMLDAQLQELA